MRKSYFAIIALGALVIASCQKENSADLPKVDSPVFTASLDADSDTKTVLDGNTSLWKQDHIWILNGDPNDNGWKKEYQTEATKISTATFTESNKDKTLDKGPVVAVCPAYAGGYAWWNASVDKIVNKLWLEPEQTAEAGGYDPRAHVAVAYSETTSLEFKNAVSLLKFTVASDNVTEVRVCANGEVNAAGGENVLSGNFSFNTETNKVTIPTVDGITNKDVKVKGAFEKGNTYYIACLPTKFTSGFTVEVVSNNINGDNKTTAKNYELTRNKILDLGSVEYKKTLYLKPNDNWNKDGAWFAAYFFLNNDQNKWVEMEKDGDYYKVVAPDVTMYPKVVFCRMNPASKDLNWNNKWNQTGDLIIGNDNCYIITAGAWDKNGSWSCLQ